MVVSGRCVRVSLLVRHRPVLEVVMPDQSSDGAITPFMQEIDR